MINDVTFKVFSFDKIGNKKNSEITLKIKSIKTICCGGCGCTIYYKNGKRKTILWDDTRIKQVLDDDLESQIWFNNETYNLFSNWKEQFSFDKICQQDNLF